MPVTVPIGPEGTATAVVNGSGTAMAGVGPLTAREVWNPAIAHVSVSTNANEATCTIYAGDTPIQAHFRDATFSGSTGDSTDRISADVIKSGQKIWAVWTGGDPGSTATLNVTGTKNV